MLVTRRKLLQQLDGDNAEHAVDELLARQVPRTPAREQFPDDEMEWAENTVVRRDPDITADRQTVINLTTQARIYFGTGLNPQEHKKQQETASFVLEGLHQIFYGTLIYEASRDVMRPIEPELVPSIFHPREVTVVEGEISAIVATRPPAVIFVVKWVERQYDVLNKCVAALDLETIIRQYISEKDCCAAFSDLYCLILLHVLVAAETEYFGLKGVTLVLKQNTTQVRVDKTDHTATFDSIKEPWDMYNRMKPRKTPPPLLHLR